MRRYTRHCATEALFAHLWRRTVPKNLYEELWNMSEDPTPPERHPARATLCATPPAEQARRPPQRNVDQTPALSRVAVQVRPAAQDR